MLPNEAFWIDNYWRTVRGCAQFAPVHWRNSKGCIRVLDDEEIQINKTGLDSLFISGSANPSLENMLWLKKTYGDEHPIYIIDLRQETHLFVNGLPISIFYKRNEINWGKTLAEINEAEHTWVNYLLNKKVLTVNSLGRPKAGFKVPINPFELKVREAYTEEDAAHKAGLNYLRMPIPDFHPPTPEQVDQFLAFYKNLPKNAWLHFHCAAGNGRSTTFMAMTDILANGKQVTLEDIINRQALLGGIDLFAPSKSLKAQPWKSKYHEARTDFIKLFFDYVQSKSYPTQSFTTWIGKKKTSLYMGLMNS
jgi:hypothetical protein